MAFDFGLDLNPAITFLFGKFISLLDTQTATTKERFERIFEHMYNSLSDIHKAYIKMFDAAIYLLPKHEEGIAYMQSINQHKSLKQVAIGSNSYLERIAFVKEKFNAEGMENGHIRQQARDLSVEVIKRSNNDIEKIFSWRVLYYFLDNMGAVEDEHGFLASLVINGKDTMLDSPKTFAEHNFFSPDIVDAELIQFGLLELKSDLQDRFAKVSESYITMLNNVYKN